MPKKLMTLAEVDSEINRIKKALEKTTSKHLRSDYHKYLKRLEQRRREIARNIEVDKLLEQYEANKTERQLGGGQAQ